jgi:hypothetical protein
MSNERVEEGRREIVEFSHYYNKKGGWWPLYDGGFDQNSFLNRLIALYPKVDLNRIYFTGLSAGGYSTLVYPSMRYKERGKIEQNKGGGGRG